LEIHSFFSMARSRKNPLGATSPPGVASKRRASRRSRPRGQALVELAITLPVLLLMVGGAVDFGRLFFTRVSIENAAKEGAFFGATNPRCDVVRQACVEPGTVKWHAQNETPGLPVTVAVQCLHGGSSVATTSCREDDTYRVVVTHQFQLVTPILSAAFGSGITLATSATSLVLNDAFDPSAAPVTP
jgi:Flp pilus assembly protein TadG